MLYLMIHSNTFYLQLNGIEHMIKDWSMRGNWLKPQLSNGRKEGRMCFI